MSAYCKGVALSTGKQCRQIVEAGYCYKHSSIEAKAAWKCKPKHPVLILPKVTFIEDAFIEDAFIEDAFNEESLLPHNSYVINRFIKTRDQRYGRIRDIISRSKTFDEHEKKDIFNLIKIIDFAGHTFVLANNRKVYSNIIACRNLVLNIIDSERYKIYDKEEDLKKFKRLINYIPNRYTEYFIKLVKMCLMKI